MSGYLLNTYTMHKVRDNYLAEILITIVILIMLLTSCKGKKQEKCNIKELHYHKSELYTNHPTTDECEGTDSVIYITN